MSDSNNSSSRLNNNNLSHLLLPDPLPLSVTQITITTGAGTSSQIASVTAIGTEIESALNARGLKETGTESEIRGMRNALKRRESRTDLVHPLPHNFRVPVWIYLVYRSVLSKSFSPTTRFEQVTTRPPSKPATFYTPWTRPDECFGSSQSPIWTGFFHRIDHQLNITLAF